MNNSNPSPKSSEPASRIEQEHGGTLVEAIAQEQLASFNDADCPHETKVPDPSETEFDAYICANPRCNEVFLYVKS